MMWCSHVSARQISKLLGFEAQDQTRIATAVSEIAHALNYGQGGKLEILVDGKTATQPMVIRISDRGAGIANLDEILDGRYRSATGMGQGILGARRLVDQFQIESAPNVVTLVLLKKLPVLREALERSGWHVFLQSARS